MTKVIGYNQLPDEKEFINLYLREQLTTGELARRYGCNGQRIRKWVKIFGLALRGHTGRAGDGNNRKYRVDKELLRELADKGYSNKFIAHSLKLPPKRITYILWKNGIRRNPKLRTEYQKYCRKVRRHSEHIYEEHKYTINPNNFPRTLCGVEGGYQLDHKIGIKECFAMELTVEYCSSIDNLQIIPWQDNLQKRKYIKGLSDE